MQTYDRPSHTVSEVAEDFYPAEIAQSPQLSVVACSLCLRVQLDSGWVEAEQAIGELRSYELPEPIGLEPGLCDRCRDLIRARRSAATLSR